MFDAMTSVLERVNAKNVDHASGLTDGNQQKQTRRLLRDGEMQPRPHCVTLIRRASRSSRMKNRQERGAPMPRKPQVADELPRQGMLRCDDGMAAWARVQGKQVVVVTGRDCR